MSKPYDATTKALIEANPADWLRYAGLDVTDVEIIDADLSTVTADADKIIRARAPDPWLYHLELQGGYDRTLPKRSLRYNVLAYYQHDLPVHTIVVLLRPEADGPAMTGEIQVPSPIWPSCLSFRYQIERVWLKPVQEVLSGGLATLPLAPLSDVRPEMLPGVIRKMEDRINQEATPQEAGLLWTSTYVLMGLRYSPGMIQKLLERVTTMEESATYQIILAKGEGRGEIKGKLAEARAILLRMGSKRFGPPDVGTRAAIEVLSSVEQIEALFERLLDVGSWDELLAGAF